MRQLFPQLYNYFYLSVYDCLIDYIFELLEMILKLHTWYEANRFLIFYAVYKRGGVFIVLHQNKSLLEIGVVDFVTRNTRVLDFY